MARPIRRMDPTVADQDRLIDQVVEAAMLHGTATRAEAERRAVALFKKLSLPNPETIGERYPHQVSGGQLQRVMTAMALCSEPDLIVFDHADKATSEFLCAQVAEAINTGHPVCLRVSDPHWKGPIGLGLGRRFQFSAEGLVAIGEGRLADEH